jgi:hypothetical protein
MVEISPAKVAHIIIRAREYDAKVAAWDESAASANAENEAQTILEDLGDDSLRAELAEFIAGLNDDEQASLVALTWIGRGTYDAEQWNEAVTTARSERVNPTADYLLGIPLLGDYLAEGLEKMGLSDVLAEEEVLGFEERTAPPET